MSLLMVLGGQAMAQTRGAMFLSGAFPLNDFADFDGLDDFALTSADLDDSDAGAGVGFSAGLKWYFNMGVKGLDVMLSVDGIYNGPNADLKAAYRNNEGYIGGQIIGAGLEYNSTPKFINVPFMLGLNYLYHFNPNLGVYVQAGAGGNARFITDMEYVVNSHIWILEADTKVTNSYDAAFSFAYQVGAGVEVAKNLVIGCSFYDLGRANVKGERIVKGDSNSPYAETWGTVHPMMFLARVGFSF